MKGHYCNICPQKRKKAAQKLNSVGYCCFDHTGTYCCQEVVKLVFDHQSYFGC